MNNSKNLLTVAIPTYNRSKTLEAALIQLGKEKNQSFEILVSDNNSTDNTRSLIRKYQKTMPNLKYSRNETNLGYSGNILKLYELSKTRYIWFLSDDETVLPGAIEIILKSLIKYRSRVFIFNHLRIDPYGRKLEDGVIEDISYNNPSNFPVYSIIRACFISIIVLEKRLSVEKIRRIFKQNNVYFQVSLVSLLLKNKFALTQVAKPIVFRNNTFESGEFFKFLLTDWIDAFVIVRNKFDKKIVSWARTQVLNSLQLYLAQKIGMYKYNGKPSIETLKKIIKYYNFYSLLIFLFPVIYYLMPRGLLEFVYKKKLKDVHGEKRALKIYKENKNRVYKIKQNSGFVNYR